VPFGVSFFAFCALAVKKVVCIEASLDVYALALAYPPPAALNIVQGLGRQIGFFSEFFLGVPPKLSG
jgi:hypothetical protein